MVDKLLLLILVAVLPIGLMASYQLFPKEVASPKKQEEVEKKLDTLVQQLTVTAQQKSEEAKPIQFGQVSYASQSGVLSVSGTAPAGNAAVLVSATVLPVANPTSSPGLKKTESELIKGSKVEVVSIQPNANGVFKFDYEVGKVSSGIVELRFEQLDSVKNIRFDLATKKQLI